MTTQSAEEIGTRHHRGCTVWLTGVPSAGKSTVARHAAELLERRGVRVDVLDGDDLRRSLCADLGYSRADREENVRRIGLAAARLTRHQVVALVPVIAPYATSRDRVRAAHRAADLDFAEVYVTAPLDVCAARDVKGLYAAQREGHLVGLTGVDAPYEAPSTPDLTLRTHRQSEAESAIRLACFITSWIGWDAR